MSSGSNFRFDSFHALSASMSNDYRALLAYGSALVHLSANHSHQMVACDFFVSLTACFRLFYVLRGFGDRMGAVIGRSVLVWKGLN